MLPTCSNWDADFETEDIEGALFEMARRQSILQGSDSDSELQSVCDR